MKRNRPGGVKFLFILCLLIGVWNLVRFVMTIPFWNFLSEYIPKGGPLLIAISGAAWATVAFFVGFSVWQGKPWSWGMSVGLFMSYGIWVLFDQLVLQVNRVNQTFELILTMVWLIISGLVLSSQIVRKFFHEQSS